jgi:type IV secretion system protein TrbL
MACGLTDPLGCVTDVAGGVGKQVAGDVFDEIAQSFATAAEDATKWLWDTMGQATAVSLSGAGWQRDIGITVSLALVIGVGLFVIQVIASALRQDFGGLGRAVRGMFIAWGAGAAAISITESLLYVADQLSQGIMQVGAGTSSWQGFGQKVLAATSIASIAGPEGTAAVLLLIALVIVVASVIVWAALMIRKLLLIVAAVFAPVAFSGAQSDLTASWVRKWIEVTIALVASKVILVIIFVVGLGVLDTGVGQSSTQSGTGQLAQTATQVVIGAMILCMAGFAPWLAIKMVHFAGDSFHTIHAHAQGVGQGARTAAQVPQKFRDTMQRGSGQQSKSSSKANGSTTNPSQAQPKPEGGASPASGVGGGSADADAADGGGIGATGGAPAGGVAGEGAAAGEGAGAAAGAAAGAGPVAAAAAPVIVAEAGEKAAKHAAQQAARTANGGQDQMAADQARSRGSDSSPPRSPGTPSPSTGPTNGRGEPSPSSDAARSDR